MRALDRKLLRDLAHLRGQVVTIALVVAAGIASWICLRSAYGSLVAGRDAFYERARFADLFVHLERAPLSLAAQLAAVPGVARVDTRIVRSATLPLPDLERPGLAQLVSLPDRGPAPLDDLHLVLGRRPDPERSEEIVLLESFATARRITIGDPLPAVIGGRLRTLRVVGIAMSPEFVFAAAPGALTVEGTFTAIWMPRTALAAAFRMEGAFDDVVVRLRAGASEEATIAELDRLLAPYGGQGTIPRRLQASDYFLEGELAQLRAFASVAPAIFLAVAAFLLHLVLARLVQLQRTEIAVLKAVGYPDRAIGLHYLGLVLAMAAIGTVIGVAAGGWLGAGMMGLYADYFRFPGRTYRLGADVVASGVLVSVVAAVAGAMSSVRGITRLPPAESMRPPAPTTYRPTWLSRGLLARLFETSGRMVLRELERRPVRALLSSAGIAFAISILVVGRFSADALEVLLDEQFQGAMREDVAITLAQPAPERAVRQLAHLPGVVRAEGIRFVAARVRSGARFRDVIVQGHEPDHELRALLDEHGGLIAVPTAGALVTRKLAEILGARPGDLLRLEPREGDRQERTVRIAGLVEEPFGLWVHLDAALLTSLLGEEPRVSSIVLRVDREHLGELRRRLAAMPAVLSVAERRATIETFRAQSGRSMTTMTVILTVFAVVIAIGIVYNNARISLSMRARDLASLRVLGFTRGEISAVLLGELAVQMVVATPLGLALGTWLAQQIMETADPERYRLHTVISSSTYAFAAVVAVGAAVASALLVRRRLDRLDLVGVLKTRE